MKRILIATVIGSFLLTVPFIASAQAGFRGDSNQHGVQRESRDARHHEQADYRHHRQVRGYEDHHHKKHHRKHYKKRHVARREVMRRHTPRRHAAPVREHVVYRDAPSVIIPVPGVVLGFPSVAVRIGW